MHLIISLSLYVYYMLTANNLVCTVSLSLNKQMVAVSVYTENVNIDSLTVKYNIQ